MATLLRDASSPKPLYGVLMILLQCPCNRYGNPKESLMLKKEDFDKYPLSLKKKKWAHIIE